MKYKTVCIHISLKTQLFYLTINLLLPFIELFVIFLLMQDYLIRKLYKDFI
jgi:hypothetical protein